MCAFELGEIGDMKEQLRESVNTVEMEEIIEDILEKGALLNSPQCGMPDLA